MINNKEIEFLNNYTPEKKPTKEDLQIRKLQLQIEALEEKKKAQQQKQIELTQQQQIDFSQIIKILFYIFIIPIGIIGGFFVECAKASAGSGTRRR